MKKRVFSILSLILALLMLSGALCTTLASCTSSGNDETSESSNETTKENSNGDEKESDTSKGNGNGDGNETETPGGNGNGNEGGGNGNNPPVVGPTIDAMAPSIDYANLMANGVQSYFTNPEREDYRIENLNMNIDFSLKGTKKLTAITNKNGGTYIKDTMDVYVVGESGKKVFASQAAKDVRTNIYRIGYYYYDVHMLDTNFVGDLNVLESTELSGRLFDAKHNVSNLQSNSSRVMVTASAGSPYIYMSGGKDRFSFSADEYNALTFTMTSENVTSVKLYYVAGSQTGHNESQSVSINTIPDGKEHTYTILFTEGSDFNDLVYRLRLDFRGAVAGETIHLSDLKLSKVEASGVAGLYFDRTFHTYSDKLHQELHFIATSKVTGIQEMGMITEVAANTVDKLVVKDANGLHYALSEVDWNTAEYVGFDIKGVGVFGYILPVHKNAGKITVELAGDDYVITQTFCPENGSIEPINAKVTYTDNDFFTGNRIYTDTNHTFDAFITEAEIERNPLSKSVSSDGFVEYDALDGAYTFTISGTGFNGPFFYDWHNHYSVSALMRSDNDRTVYIRTITDSGCLENAAILNDKNLVVPIPAEVSKNFGGENEEPIFFSGDRTYGETVFPLVLTANTRVEFTVLNLYQNWGRFPLKQLSSIQYFWPYYHLSIGTTETSCISPWYGARDLWTLPDFRAQSQPYWFELEEGMGYSNQPQHTHAGYQYFMQYTDASGNYAASENISNVIDSSGPVYAEVEMAYISDDGKIKITYTHIEFAQEDELRAYYEIEYEILDEVTIKDFKNDFSFYSFEGYSGQYRKLGYLDENGNPVNRDANLTDVPEGFKLGKESPYVSLFDLYSPGDSWENNNANLAFIIYNSEFIFSGEKCDENFYVTGANAKYSLSLNLDEVTLKPGDTMKINMIISPWGAYNSTDDKNVQTMRENTCLNPLSIEVSNGKKIESVFVPRVKSTDGTTAEFTLSGGTSFVPVRIYGMKNLTAPKIYEKVVVEGEETWVEYVVNSVEDPDRFYNRHYYDGYFVYKDPDGSYSYAFNVDMTDAESRTFKIVAEDDFKRWPILDTEVDTDLDVHVGPSQLTVYASSSVNGIGSSELSSDATYIRIYGDGKGYPEAYFNVFTNSDKTQTGKYIVLKYRLPTTNSRSNIFEYYSSTVNTGATGGDAIGFGGATADGEWHVVVIDASLRGNTFKATDDNKFYAHYLRLDVFNSPMEAEDYVDIAYIGMFSEISQICQHEKQFSDVEKIEVRLADSHRQFYDLNGSLLSETDAPVVEVDRVYIDPNNAQGYTQSETPYVSGIDFINGKGDGEDGDPAYNSYRSSNTSGVKVIKYNAGTHENAYLVVSGWTLVYEGIEKFVWSADGGKTWHDAVIYPEGSTLATATGGVKSMGDGQFTSSVPGFNAATYNQEYYANSVYQAAENLVKGVGAHLVDYVGQEVDVTFAAVPKNDPDGLCIMLHATNVRVYASDDDASEGEKCTHESAAAGVYKFVSDDDSNTELAKIVYTCACGEVEFESKAPSYVMFFGNINGINTAPHVAESKKAYLTFDATGFSVGGNTLSFAADENGNLKISGWAGINGGIKKIVFKVFDADGNEVTKGWTDTMAAMSARSDLNSEMEKRTIEKTYGRTYEFTLPLACFISEKNESVTVKLAFEVKGAVGNDKYLYVCDINNIKVPADPQEYVAPEIPDSVFVACTDNVTGSSVITTGDRTTNNPIVCDFGSVTSRGSASIKLVGWLGVEGGFSTLAYRVTCDGVTSEWINFNGGYTPATGDVQNAVAGAGVSKEYAYRFDVSADLFEYIGKTVSVTFAAVATDNGEHISFFEAKNVKVVCDHKSVGEGYHFVGDNDAYTDEAKIAAKCPCGEKTIDPKTPNYVFYFQDVIGESKVSGVVTCESRGEYKIVDCEAKGITVGSNGIIEIDGWGGVNGGSSKLVYRVFDSNGNELTYQWTEFDTANVYASNAELKNETSGRGIEVEYGMRFMDMKINLSNYLEGKDSITIKFAMVCDGAPEDCNDAYVYLGEFQNLKAAN